MRYVLKLEHDVRQGRLLTGGILIRAANTLACLERVYTHHDEPAQLSPSLLFVPVFVGLEHVAAVSARGNPKPAFQVDIIAQFDYILSFRFRKPAAFDECAQFPESRVNAVLPRYGFGNIEFLFDVWLRVRTINRLPRRGIGGRQRCGFRIPASSTGKPASALAGPKSGCFSRYISTAFSRTASFIRRFDLFPAFP
jgi:hypothetical protein